MTVFSVVAASSNSGKTTLIEKLIRIFKGRGLRVAAIKHAPGGFDIDKPGKDSWRFQQAGADGVVIAGPDRLAIIKRHDHLPSLKYLETMLPGMDIVLVEGFKAESQNKIEVFRSGISGEQPLCMSDPSFTALVSDRPYPVSIPCFDLNNAEGVAAFLLKRIHS